MWGLEGIGAVATGTRQFILATQLFAAAEAMRVQFGVSRQPHEQLIYEKALATIRPALDPHTFADAWERGGDPSVPEALALVETHMPFGGPRSV
jgi:hypothetical protein